MHRAQAAVELIAFSLKYDSKGPCVLLTDLTGNHCLIYFISDVEIIIEQIPWKDMTAIIINRWNKAGGKGIKGECREFHTPSWAGTAG